MQRPRLVILALSGALALLSGCGNTEPDAVFDQDNILRLEVDEYRISPQVIRIKADSEPTLVRIVMKNTGHLTHNVHIEQTGKSVHGTSTDADFGGTATAQPGGTERSAYMFLLPGRYRLTCTISNHDNLGQHGTLIIEPPAR